MRESIENAIAGVVRGFEYIKHFLYENTVGQNPNWVWLSDIDYAHLNRYVGIWVLNGEAQDHWSIHETFFLLLQEITYKVLQICSLYAEYLLLVWIGNSAEVQTFALTFNKLLSGGVEERNVTKHELLLNHYFT